MSLSSWLRDYLYIPLGGNHGGPAAHARNVLITMLLGGLWHGASWTFVAWGGLHGVGLIVCHAWQRLSRGKGRRCRRAIPCSGIFFTFAFVAFAWIFFRSASFEIAGVVLQRFATPALPTLLSWQIALLFLALLLAAHVAFYRLNLEAAVARIKNDFVYAAALGGGGRCDLAVHQCQRSAVHILSVLAHMQARGRIGYSRVFAYTDKA